MIDLTLASNLEGYRNAYPAREPYLGTMQNDDELKQFGPEDGRGEMSIAPATGVVQGNPPDGRGSSENKYLWAIEPEGVPSVLEDGPAGKAVARGYASHTNLTGGGLAHCGGELWFRDVNSFWLSGSSGRYRPRSGEELAAVVASFRKSGYAVASFGWDGEAGRPAKFLRGEAQWT